MPTVQPPPVLWHRFVVGAAAEMLAVCASHPADVLKVRLQLTGEGNSAMRTLSARDILNSGRGLVVNEGVRNGLYAGISASWSRQFVFSGLRHGLYGVLEHRWKQEFGSISLPGRTVCALSSGCFAAVIGNPTDVVLIRMQSDGHWPPEQRRRYSHIFDGLRRIVRHEGVATLWRGCSPTVMRAALVTTSQIGTYEEVKHCLLRAGYAESFSMTIICAIASATVACFVTAPVDIVKTRIMNMQQGCGVSYKGPMDVIKRTLRQEGPLGFYKGLSACFLRLWPHTVLLWIGQEKIGALLKSI